jgi:hypothetical protein
MECRSASIHRRSQLIRFREIAHDSFYVQSIDISGIGALSNEGSDLVAGIKKRPGNISSNESS